MNHEHRHIANSILDRHKDGEEFSPATIRRSLEITGDITPDGGEVLDQTIQEDSQGGGSVRSISMVAENLVRLSEKAWTTRR